MSGELQGQPQEKKKGALPPIRTPITWTVIVACAGIAVLLNVDEGSARLMEVLAPDAVVVWHGAVWGLLTSAFVHLAIWHILFNMWWARDFGRLLEPSLGRVRYLGFIAGAAVVSSGWQLLVSGETGIGFSGVVYAFFGYTVARRKANSAYAAFLTQNTISWLFGWLVLCIALTAAGIWNVANIAHASGLAFGLLVGVPAGHPRARALARAALAVLALGTALSCAYAPWSEAWQTRKALYDVHRIVRGAAMGDTTAQARLGGLLVRYPDRRPEGIALLRRSAEAGDPHGMNGLAWALATCPDAGLRNGAEAIRWAEKACGRDPSAMFTDTLAAAYAEAGRWAEAVATQERAIARLPADFPPDARKGYEERLARLKRREPVRDEP